MIWGGCRFCAGRGCRYCASRPSIARFPVRLKEAEKLIVAWKDVGFFDNCDRSLLFRLASDDGVRAIEAAINYGRRNPSVNEGEIVAALDPTDRWSYLEFEEGSEECQHP